MLGVEGVLLDRGVEPEAVAVLLAVVERRLELFAPSAPTAAATTATATTTGSGARAALGTLLALLVLVTLVLGLLRLLGLLGLGGGLDLRFDLVTQVDFAGAGALVVGREVVLLAELAQLGRADLQLVGDPGIGPALVDPGADLVELRLQRASSHRRASLLKEGIRLQRGEGRYDIRKESASNIASTTTTTVAVRQTARTLKRTLPSCSTRLILRARERLAARRRSCSRRRRSR